MAVRCWAASLGGCTKQSREHYVTKGLFETDSVRLKGLPWCQVEEKEIGLGSAWSKILCKVHNERLSLLDDEAIKAFECFREIARLQKIQRELPKRHWKVRTWQLDGRLLERWFLKTLINLVIMQTKEVKWPKSAEPRLPPKDVVAACFGRAPIESPRGLYAAAEVGQNIDRRDYVSFAPIKDQKIDALAGGLFEFRGFRFVLAWSDRSLERFINNLADISPEHEGWRHSKLMHPFRGLNFNLGDRRAQEVKIVWRPFRPDPVG